jgi:hypothetical protein
MKMPAHHDRTDCDFPVWRAFLAWRRAAQTLPAPSPLLTRAREKGTALAPGTPRLPHARAMAGSPMKRMRKAGITDPVTGEPRPVSVHAARCRATSRLALVLDRREG